MADTNMTVDQAIAYAIQWAPATVRGADGWRVVCMVLAQEVQRLRGERQRWLEINAMAERLEQTALKLASENERLRGERNVLEQLLGEAGEVLTTVDGESIEEDRALHSLRDRIADARGAIWLQVAAQSNLQSTRSES